jgi:hypothetical protein
MSIARLDPSSITRDPVFPHRDYPVQMGGQYEGRFEANLPIYDVWTDYRAKKNAERAMPGAKLNPRDPQGFNADRRGLELGFPIQKVTAQWQDEVMKKIEAKLKGDPTFGSGALSQFGVNSFEALPPAVLMALLQEGGSESPPESRQ